MNLKRMKPFHPNSKLKVLLETPSRAHLNSLSTMKTLQISELKQKWRSLSTKINWTLHGTKLLNLLTQLKIGKISLLKNGKACSSHQHCSNLFLLSQKQKLSSKRNLLNLNKWLIPLSKLSKTEFLKSKLKWLRSPKHLLNTQMKDKIPILNVSFRSTSVTALWWALLFSQ